MYTAAPVAGGWAGAVMSWERAVMSWAGAVKAVRILKVGLTDQQTDRHSDLQLRCPRQKPSKKSAIEKDKNATRYKAVLGNQVKLAIIESL